MSERRLILIVGGYGKVGSLIAAELAPEYPGRVVVAGRDPAKAQALAERLGFGVQSRQIDVHDPDAVGVGLEGADLVVNCIDQEEPHLLRAAIKQGLAYTDITADHSFCQLALSMDSQASQSGARILLGAGLIPGIANVMARSAWERAGEAESVHTGLLLSMGDAFGPAALDFMLSTAAEPFFVTEGGQQRKVTNFTEGREVVFPEPIGRREVYRFALPDQFFYPQTLGVHTAASRIALDPTWVTSVFAGVMGLGGALLFKHAGIRRGFSRLFGRLQKVHAGQDTYAVVVEARGSEKTARLSLLGRGESSGTALGAVPMVQALYEGQVKQPGVWLPEQVIEPSAFFDKLAARGLNVISELIPRSG